ncbi:MAG: hypothetical protein M1822_003889 [Bathelium mastoideum]|nr:MAG: hypothetical protein M1822_003889 [Bathelium mastoideum]
MVVVIPTPADLSAETLSLFTTTDPLLSNLPVFIFYGPSAATAGTSNSSRIQAHVFAAPGLRSYPRLTVSPSSPLYAAVTGLPREEQGDEVSRGLAFSIYKYFLDVPEEIKGAWAEQLFSTRKPASAFNLFSDTHAALLASRMTKLENVKDVASDIRLSLAKQSVPWVDVDLVLPTGSMQKLEKLDTDIQDDSDDVLGTALYGKYAALVKPFGEAAFIPTSRLRRAPSRPTAINRTMSFSKKQKEALRREMCEFVDTEESYVSKIYDLVHSVAADFRAKAEKRAPSSTSPTLQALVGLFPPSLDEILKLNTNFMESVRAILEETENTAIADIDASEDALPKSFNPSEAKRSDITGALAFAKCLVEWFPKFADCYGDYMQVHADVSQLLRLFMKDAGSSFSKRIQETGEQRLTSMLIEPVQRLPRYNLYIDNIIKQLPVRHPAIKPLLQARDIVTEICSRDDPSKSQSKILGRLHRLIPSWPKDFRPNGRLITAMDVVELAPPYHLVNSRQGSGIILLFSDYIVLLVKNSVSAMTARGLLAEIDKPDTPTSTRGDRPCTPQNLEFLQHLEISLAHFTELEGGSTVQLLCPKTPVANSENCAPTNLVARAFYLTGGYENKAARWIEEVVRARVEGRYPENEREGPAWEVRSVYDNDRNTGLFTAILEDQQPRPKERGRPARIRVMVESLKREFTDAEKESSDVLALVVPADDDVYRTEVYTPFDGVSRNHVKAGDVLRVLSKKVALALQSSNTISNPNMTACLLTRNEQILQTLQSLHVNRDPSVPEMSDHARERGGSLRAPSPVKLLSSLFGGSVRDGHNPRKLQRPVPNLGEVPRMGPPSQNSRPATQDSSKSFDDTTSKSSIPLGTAGAASTTLLKLEETLAAYVLALHARKGNVVGKTLRARATADELAVNELYNVLLENPDDHQMAAQASVDVLFASFEKFIRAAWSDKMGPIVPMETMAEIQSKSESLFPVDFGDYFRNTFFQLSPQNQRALKGIVRLLADLLDGTGNDGDRGILTVAFAEILIPEGNPHDFFSLLDRFVDDVDSLFGEVISHGTTTPNEGSVTSHKRERTANTSSISSNTSSLRKRFGLGTLSRENSKHEQDNKVSSVWRTLSKTGRSNNTQPASFPKGSLVRSNSTDVDIRTPPRRPHSRDRPTVLGAFSFEDPLHNRSPFLQGSPLGTIGEAASPQIGSASEPRKKRRSSLSDLKTLKEAQDSPSSWSPRTPGSNGTVIRRQISYQPSPLTPSPTKIPVSSSPSSRLASPGPKENSPTLQRALPPARQPPVVRKESGAVTGQSPSKLPNGSVSGIPTLRPSSSQNSGALTERPSSGNSTKIPPSQSTGVSPTKLPSANTSPTKLPMTAVSNGSPKKLRMQSPQKLRERLQNEQKAIATTATSFDSEISSIRAGMDSSGRTTTQSSTATRPLRTAKATSPQPPALTTPSSQTLSDLKTLSTRLDALESTHRTTVATLTQQLSSLSSDTTTSLQVSEVKARKLDQLYREANAENEALYARFNDELAKVMKSVRASTDGGVEVLRQKLAEAQEDAAKGKREVARLKREVVGLRAQLRDG